MSRSLLMIIVALAVSTFAAAQQLEVNDAGGSLTNAGTEPVPGSPLSVNVFSGSISPRIGATPNTGFILATGNLAAASVQLLPQEWWDLDIPSTVVVGDGIGNTGVLPAFYRTNASGVCNFLYTANLALNGATIPLQAVTLDAAAPGGLNLTAAYVYSFTNALNFQGDDTTQTFIPMSGAYSFYGTSFTSIAVCTNGWVKFGTTTSADLSESVAEFLAGTPGNVAPAAPLIAVDWEDQDLANTPAARVVCSEDIVNRVITVEWQNGEYYSSSPIWGTIRLTIADNFGAPIVTMNYTAYAPVTPPSEGIVGISDGQLGGPAGADLGADLVVGGAVVPFASPGDFTSYFQSFDGLGGFGTPAAEPIDVGGLVLTWVDTTGLGNWAVF